MKSLIREDNKREFSITHARELVRDLYRPNPWIYWSDFLGSALLGWGAFARTLMAPTFSLQQGFCFLITVSNTFQKSRIEAVQNRDLELSKCSLKLGFGRISAGFRIRPDFGRISDPAGFRPDFGSGRISAGFSDGPGPGPMAYARAC